jgi:ribonucleoside-diphosphate reductase alpha chain
LSVQRLRLVARRTGTRFPLELRATTELISADAGLVFPQRLNRYPPFVGFTNARSVFVPGAGTVLPPGAGVCSLDLDLTQFVQAPFTHEADFDLRGFAAVVRNAVHLLDNAIDLSAWPSPECGAVMQQHRPIRLGLTGLGDALIMLRLVYGSAPAMMQAATIASTLCTESHRASAFLARKRGACAVFSVSETEEDWSLEKCYRHSAFASGLPAEVRKQIESHGLRHSRLLGIGTPNVSSLAFADGVSAGLDPVLRWERCYTPTDPAGEAPEPFCDYAWRYLQHCDPQLGVPQRPDFLLRAAVDPREHAKQVASVRRYLDGGLTLAGLTGEESLPQFLELAERQWSETKL